MVRKLYGIFQQVLVCLVSLELYSVDVIDSRLNIMSVVTLISIPLLLFISGIFFFYVLNLVIVKIKYHCNLK